MANIQVQNLVKKMNEKFDEFITHNTAQRKDFETIGQKELTQWFDGRVQTAIHFKDFLRIIAEFSNDEVN